MFYKAMLHSHLEAAHDACVLGGRRKALLPGIVGHLPFELPALLLAPLRLTQPLEATHAAATQLSIALRVPRNLSMLLPSNPAAPWDSWKYPVPYHASEPLTGHLKMEDAGKPQPNSCRNTGQILLTGTVPSSDKLQGSFLPAAAVEAAAAVAARQAHWAARPRCPAAVRWCPAAPETPARSGLRNCSRRPSEPCAAA